MSQVAAWVSAIAAVVSIGAAIWATLKGAKAHRDSLSIQAKLVAIEQSREDDRLAEQRNATLRAELVGEHNGRGSKSYRLRITNHGRAEARNVDVTMDGKPIMEHRAVPRNLSEIRQVGPGAYFQYVLALSFSCSPPFEIEITWQDDSGTPGRFRTTLSF